MQPNQQDKPLSPPPNASASMANDGKGVVMDKLIVVIILGMFIVVGILTYISFHPEWVIAQ